MDLDFKRVDEIINIALTEDIGKGDITSDFTIDDNAKLTAKFVFREGAIFCGTPVLERIYTKFPDISYNPLIPEGKKVRVGTAVFEISGNAKTILKTERVALNLIQRMSGIATQTSKYVEKIAHTKAKILDTRKTTPGLRILEKYSVWIGGGNNHRFCLDDAILIKDNHIAICGNIENAIRKAKEKLISNNKKLTLEIECDNLDQAAKAIELGVDIILLDNMDLDSLRKAVKMAEGTNIRLEASGGVNLENVKDIAETGVDFISVGALTHSVKSVDIGLDTIYSKLR